MPSRATYGRDQWHPLSCCDTLAWTSGPVGSERARWCHRLTHSTACHNTVSNAGSMDRGFEEAARGILPMKFAAAGSASGRVGGAGLDLDSGSGSGSGRRHTSVVWHGYNIELMGLEAASGLVPIHRVSDPCLAGCMSTGCSDINHRPQFGSASFLVNLAPSVKRAGGRAPAQPSTSTSTSTRRDQAHTQTDTHTHTQTHTHTNPSQLIHPIPSHPIPG
ncbi:uncharacterized protein IWZ02DRAFT_70444 [Phyllosticta citriasiana]|uniref:uncharacterized protein n=1 Tax=Phyllosticta citriasiana TaxID=595635 RepID=UPI0030FDAF8B